MFGLDDLILLLILAAPIIWVVSGGSDEEEEPEPIESIRVYPSERRAIRRYDREKEEYYY